MQLLADRETKVEQNLEKSVNVLETNAVTQKETMEIAWKNQRLNEELKNLVLENKRKENILLGWENNLKEKFNELAEREKEIRKEEIRIEARKSDVRRKENAVSQKEEDIKDEGKRIKEREIVSDKVKVESEEKISRYEKLFKEIEQEQEELADVREETEKREEDSKSKNAFADEIFEKAKKIDEDIKAKEKSFEEARIKIESALNEKIMEYDRRIEDLKSAGEIVKDIKYDDTKEGREAKIVVKEAIRKAKNSLSDLKAEFELLNEKYCDGTFKGFSTPIIEIDKDFSELKAQYQQIKDHITANESLPPSVGKWIESIESSVLKADTCLKSWEFSEGYRNIIFGLSACKNYELLLEIMNAWAGTDETSSARDPEDAFIDWYEVLEVNPDADTKKIKCQRNKLVMQYHPDKAPEDKKEEYTQRTAQINEAYAILSDEEKRRAFDEKRNNHKNNN